MNYTDLAAAVTQQLIAQIEMGPGTWRMPWHTVPGLFDVRNASTSNRYRGANVVSLALEAIEAEHPTGWWSTYRQWSDLGAQVRKGERSTRIVKWVPAKRNDSDATPAGHGADEDQRTLVPRVYSVFNASQVDGWAAPAPAAATVIERDALADAFIVNTGAQITYGHNHAAFSNPKGPTLNSQYRRSEQNGDSNEPLAAIRNSGGSYCHRRTKDHNRNSRRKGDQCRT